MIIHIQKPSIDRPFPIAMLNGPSAIFSRQKKMQWNLHCHRNLQQRTGLFWLVVEPTPLKYMKVS